MTDNGHTRPAIRIPLPPLWSVAWLVTVAAAVTLVFFDRASWHWYHQPSAGPELEAISEEVADLQAELAAAERDVTRLDDEVGDLRRGSYLRIDDPESAFQRITHGLAILSLANEPGGPYSTASAQGMACINWYMLGRGSASDCGFRLVDND